MDTEDKPAYMSYPSPASDTTDTTLPTPSLPSASSSRRPTILSPSDFNDNQMMSPIDPNGENMDKMRVSHDGKVTPGGKEGGLIPSISVEMDETPTRPRRSGRSPSGGAIGAGGGGAGLNIRGLTLPTAGKITSEDDTSARRDESEERSDSLGDLLPSPRVNAFKAALLQPSPVIPMSPAWQSFDTSASASASASGSPARRSTSGQGVHPSSPSMMFAPSGSAPSPLGPRSNERRFDPTPQHGLHARNLSLFFPSPGQQHQQREAGGSRDPFVQGAESFQEEETVLPAGEEKKVFGGKGGWSFGGQNGSVGADGQTLSPEHAKSSKRRGHHHKHSLSHNFFSFLDPTVTNPSLASPSLSPSHNHNHHPSLSTPASKSFPTNVPIPMQSSNSLMASSPTLSPLSRRFLDNRAQLHLSFAVIEFLIGAGLWVEGQLSGWRCLAAVGYLSVFDAAGVAIRMIRDGNGWRSTRRPYGTARLMTLLYFAQSLFLVFASVYIAKESIETVLLGAGAHSHDGGGGGHGHGGEHEHGHDEGHTEERSLPLLLLLLSSVTALFSGSFLGNHSQLVESVGTLFMPKVLVSARIPTKLNVLRNPFTMTVAGGSAAILLGSVLLPPSSMHILDSVLSLLLTVATSALAYPSARSFALVLLQTAPPSTSVQMSALRQSLRSIPDDRRILGIGSTRVWMIASTGCDSTESKQDHKHKRSGSGDSSPSHSVPPSPVARSFSRRKTSTTSVLRSREKDMGNTRLSVSVVVHVNDNVGDRDVLDVTKFVWNRVSAAVGEGEVSVAVKRGWEGMETS